MTEFGPLISTSELAANLGQFKIIDGSWRMPGNGNAIEHYNEEHIPGAVFFDIDKIAYQETDLPHMLPPPGQFAEGVGALGITAHDTIVIYDEAGIFSAARVWWSFRAMGHQNIAVLDGGLPKWKRENNPVTDQKTEITPAEYQPTPTPARYAFASDVRDALGAGVAVVDARPADRFAARAPEPRPGLRSGHMPGALNLPTSAVVDANTGQMRPPEEIRSAFSALGVDPEARVITSCGSGVTAAILSLALETIGARNHAVYDGSWAEWGDEKNDEQLFPVVD
ncbi:sulfurtransferase [Hyphococcus formosus]|uniref:sulfurtransferase n=1 Tax=Hyphococcus formosus TaxID=3143534 RepID=UPI00398B3871